MCKATWLQSNAHDIESKVVIIDQIQYSFIISFDFK